MERTCFGQVGKGISRGITGVKGNKIGVGIEWIAGGVARTSKGTLEGQRGRGECDGEGVTHRKEIQSKP